MQLRYVLGFLKNGFSNGIFHSEVGILRLSRRQVLIAAKRNCSSKRTTVFQRKLHVKAFGKLFLESHFLPVQVRHVESTENYVGICIEAESADEISPLKWKAYNFGLTYHAEQQENTHVYVKNEAKLNDKFNFHRPLLLIEIPVQFDVSVQSFCNNDVILSKLESTNIECSLQEGQLTTRNIKCGYLNVVSTTGDVQCQGPVLGNVNIKTAGKGRIRADRLQGSLIRLKTDEGEISANAIYADSSNIASGKGPVSLTNLHGSSKVSLYQGDLKIVGLDGSLTATVIQGNADIRISRLLPNSHAAVVANDGNIILRLPDDLVARLRLEGKDVKVEDKVQGIEVTESERDGIIFNGFINAETPIKDPLITAVAPMGEVTVRIQNWLPKFN